VLAHQLLLAVDGVGATTKEQGHPRRDRAGRWVDSADDEPMGLVRGEDPKIAASCGDENRLARPRPHGSSCHGHIRNYLPRRVEIPTWSLQHQPRNTSTFGRFGGIRGDRRSERVRGIDERSNTVRPQEGLESVDATEAADANVPLRQAGPLNAAGQRGDHICTVSHERCGDGTGLSGAAEDEDAHRPRLAAGARETVTMRQLLVIGIGPGHPDQITVQAVRALNRVDVFFFIDKGESKSSLNAVRDEILRRHVTEPRYRIVEIAEPVRDRSSSLTSDGYRSAVQDWHAARAERIGAAISTELDDDGVGAFLVWGDPSVYDSMLRIVERIVADGSVDFDLAVIPGVTSVQALAAAHRIPLNRIGEPIHITPARRIAGGLPDGLDSAVVMLDTSFTAAAFSDASLDVFWGAYLSTADEVLIAGRLGDVADQIIETRERLRAEHGWIMDMYLLRRQRPEDD
jgi:precorrin-6A synthase